MQRILTPLLLLFVGVCLSTMLTRSCQKPKIEIINKLGDTVIVERVDTFTIIKPVPYRVEVRDTIRLTDTIYIGGQMLFQEVKEYKDSSYYARVSGINAFLEEIRVYPKCSTVYINTTEKVYLKPKKWDIGLQGGIGITPKGVQPYVGFGVTRRLEF